MCTTIHLYIAIILYYIEFYCIWIATLCISYNVTEKENDDCVPFLKWFFFCTDYDNDFKAVCITFLNYIPVLESLLNFYLYGRFYI
jgi:hypothetical protein